MKNYYDISEQDNFEELFSDLAVSKKPTLSRGKYLILNFDFSEVSAQGDIEKIVENFYSYCNKRYKAFQRRYKKIIDNFAIEKDALASLDELFMAVEESPYKIYVLIDEYDNFINEIMVKGRRKDYEKLVTGEGIVKTFFKKIKAHSGSIIDKIFITGISPVVLNDISSGFNIAKDITFRENFNDMCGFKEQEIRQVVETIIEEQRLQQQSKDILQVMKKYYNGYCFNIKKTQKIYNPTLSLYFLENLQQSGNMPEEMLDKNLQTDINKLDFLSRIELGRKVILEILENRDQIKVSKVVMEFQLKDLLELEKQDEDYIASMMLFFGLLTIKERQFNLVLEIPNSVCRKLYFEKLQNIIANRKLTTRTIQEQFFLNCNIGTVCEYIEQNMLQVLSNRDYMHADELSYKLLFLTILYRDDIYFIESERELLRDYCDIFFQVRPDMNQYGAQNILVEFKYIKLSDLQMKKEQIKAADQIDLWKQKPVKEKYQQATAQLAKYEKVLQDKYPQIKINKMVVIGLGFDKVLGKIV